MTKQRSWPAIRPTVFTDSRSWVGKPGGHADVVTAIERRQDPTSLLLKRMSEQECARFRNRNLRQPGTDRRVHEVELRDWVGGLKLPAPAISERLPETEMLLAVALDE